MENNLKKYIHITESLCCTPETSTIQYCKSTILQLKKEKKNSKDSPVKQEQKRHALVDIKTHYEVTIIIVVLVQKNKRIES